MGPRDRGGLVARSTLVSTLFLGGRWRVEVGLLGRVSADLIFEGRL
jgi:hypothetical protein